MLGRYYPGKDTKNLYMITKKNNYDKQKFTGNRKNQRFFEARVNIFHTFTYAFTFTLNWFGSAMFSEA